MNTQNLGLVVMVISLMMAANIYFLSSSLINSIDSEHTCTTVGTCPHVQAVSFSYTGYAGSAGLFLAGLYIFLRTPQPAPGTRKKRPDNLNPDEEKLFSIVDEAGGMIFQSELVEKTGFPKARVTRILDRLESRDVLERRRRGMTNAVLRK